MTGDPASRSAGEGVLGRARRVHFIGIGGIGMSGLAELLVNLGYQVSGCDMQRSEITDRLKSLGAEIFEAHDAGHLRNAEVVIYSSAIKSSNPEMLRARELRLPIVPRAELLAELMKLRQGIAVAGAHGKTTTSSMIALVLDTAGLDPTAVIGGRVSSFGSNARLGRGKYLVAEADESDRSFLRLSPRFAVVTNLDREHLEAYADFDDLRASFVQFANSVASNGAVVLCLDDPHLRELLPQITRHVVTYGLQEGADVTATDVRLDGYGSTSSVRGRKPGGRVVDFGDLKLAVPGRHNVQNALAAVAMGRELGIGWGDISQALAGFHGVERRFQRRGEAGGVTVIEDYGHHPTEIQAVLSAARPIATGRVVVAFQPHRFSRTQLLFDDFAKCFAGADVLVLTDIYAAGEEPIPGVGLHELQARIAREFSGELHVAGALAEVPVTLVNAVRAGDLVLLLGAGSIGSIAPRLLELLKERR